MPQQGGAGSQNPTTISKARISPTVWNDLIGAATGLTVGPSGGADWAAWINGLYAWAFDPDAIESIFVSWQATHEFKLGTDFQPHIHFCVNSTDTTVVRWGFEYTLADINGVFGATTTLYTDVTLDGTANKHRIAEWDPDIAAPFAEVSGIIYARVFRDATSGNDTFTGDAYLLSVDAHAEIDTIGSDSALTKE